MKTTFLALVALQFATITSFAATTDNDPTVMTVGDIDVKLSEFEYLYKKNDAQQSTDITLDQYIDMFVNYKLKVCAARAAGLDTTATYRSDIEKYSGELAAPYLVDRQMIDSMIIEAYNHRLEDLEVTQMILPVTTKERNEQAQLAFADSLRREAMNGADFIEIVRRHSADPSAKKNDGRMRLTGGRVPYKFEDVAYHTAVGEISPVFRTMYGLHLLRVESRRPDIGEVKARHILKLTRGLPPEEAATKRAQIDSIHSLLKDGADFIALASAETEDPSGRGNGGDLPWFGIGRMIPEFENATFGLPNGGISEPVETAYGYHIILREDHRPVAPLDSLRSQIEEALMRDYRMELAQQRCIERYGQTVGIHINDKTAKKIRQIITKQGGYNAPARQAILSIKQPLFSIGNQPTGIEALATEMGQPDITSADNAIEKFNASLDAIVAKTLRNHFKATLPDRETAYRNLINEYSDGMLLYEISNREVWDRANTDNEGLEAYFQAHRDDYAWTAPHYRGFLLSATNDSVATQALDYLATLDVEESALGQELRKKFGNTVKIDRVNAGRGDNAIIDYVAFGGEKPDAGSRWTAFREFRGSVSEQPQSALDVKGRVSVNYQQQLEQQWLEQLHNTYPVKIYRERLEHLK